MANVLIDDNTLVSIASAVRDKLGTETLYLPSELPTAISEIPSGGGSGIDTATKKLIEGTSSSYTHSQIAKIAPNFFAYNNILESINLTNCLSIGSYAFSYCTKLNTAIFNDCTYIDSSAFYNCNKLANISFPKCVTVRDAAFQANYSITSVNLPECTGLGAYAFANCSNITTVDLPKCTSIGMRAFSGCSKLTTINAESLSKLNNAIFTNGTNSLLTTINFPNLVEITAQSAFRGCTGLTFISYPFLTSTLGSYAFLGCSNISYANVGALSSINNGAFQGCLNLELLYLLSTSVCKLYNSAVFSSTKIASGAGKIYVPADLVDAYKTSNYWSAFADYIYALPDTE